jgi:hypothetical protein
VPRLLTGADATIGFDKDYDVSSKDPMHWQNGVDTHLKSEIVRIES